MSAVTFGSLLAGASRNAAAVDAPARFWRRTYDVNDSRAQVGRRLGDGSTRQGNIILAAIMEAATKWFKKVNDDRRNAYAAAIAEFAKMPLNPARAPRRPRKLKWNLLATLQAVLGFTEFKTGECIATYEMIMEEGDCGRGTVASHLRALRALGLLDWVRRCEATGKKEQPTKAAPNSYFTEISRLPREMRMRVHQILKRRGVKIQAHPDRLGSGSVPNRVQRLAGRLGAGLSGAVGGLRSRKYMNEKIAEATFVRDETALMDGIPTAQWAEIRHPGVQLRRRHITPASASFRLSLKVQKSLFIPHLQNQ